LNQIKVKTVFQYQNSLASLILRPCGAATRHGGPPGVAAKHRGTNKFDEQETA
jgi:hypothetical protein